MDLLHLFGSDKPNIISDELFNSSNIQYISLLHCTDEPFIHKPKTKGRITFITNGFQGDRLFEGESVVDVLQQMMEFCKTIK